MELTNEIYNLHQPPEVQALMALSLLDTTRPSVGAKLADQGFTIDWPIMVWGWDPVKVMAYRQQLGLTWAPSASMGQPSNAALAGPMPKGAIKVSLDAADYPPFVPPPAIPTEPHGEIDDAKSNGIRKALNVWNPDGSYKHSEGYSTVYVGPSAPAGEAVHFHIGYNIMGRSPEWLDDATWAKLQAGEPV